MTATRNALPAAPSRLTPRERARRFIRRQEPDRVPVNYSGNAGINQRMMDHFGVSAYDQLLDALGVEIRGAGAAYRGPRLHPEIPGREVSAEWGMRTRWIEHSAGGYWDFCDFPLADASADEIDRWPVPSPDDYDCGRVRQAIAARPDHFFHVGHAGLADIMNSTGMIRGVEQMLVDLAEEHEPTLRLIDRRLAVQLEVTRRVLEAAEGRIDMMWIGEDLGSQRGPLISRDMFRRLILPRHARFTKLAQQYNIPVMIHSCGASKWAWEDLMGIGVSAVDTLQPEAAGMRPAAIKKEFGDRLAFHGCISTAGPIARGTVESTLQCVRETLDAMMPGGGYCCSPTHALQDNSPTANVVAMYETVRKYGVYR